jgi:hypothetical protein
MRDVKNARFKNREKKQKGKILNSTTYVVLKGILYRNLNSIKKRRGEARRGEDKPGEKFEFSLLMHEINVLTI